MAVTEIGPTGATIGTLADYIESIEGRYRDSDIYGSNFRTGAGSVSGMHARLKGELVSDLAALLGYAIAMGNPETARGTYLHEIVQFNSITVNESVPSTVTVSFTAEPSGTTVTPADTQVSDGAGATFVPLVTQVITGSSTVAVACVATTDGPVVAGAGTLTTIDKRPYGLASTTNVTAATVGRLTESDPALKSRRRQAASVTSPSSYPGVIRALRDIDDVTDASVSITPTKYMRAVVQGGADADVAQTMHRTVAGGTLYAGTTTVVHTENGQTDPISFYRVVEKPVYITFVLEKLPGYQDAGGDEAVKTRTADLFEGSLEVEGESVPRPAIGENVVGSKISIGADSVPKCYVRDILISFAPNPTDNDDLSIEFWQRATSSATIINVVDAS